MTITWQAPLAAPITQRWGENPNDYKQFNLPGHNGLDFGAPLRTPGKPVLPGLVEKIGQEANGFGTYIKIRHDSLLPGLPGPTYSYYCHLSSYMVRTGQRVDPDQIIYLTGSTGFSTGPHLHLGVKMPGGDPAYLGWVDPFPLLFPGLPTGQPEPVIAGQAITARYRVVTARLNKRSGPGVSYPIMSELKKDDLVKGIALVEASIWIKLEDGSFCAMIHDGMQYLERCDV